MRVKVETPAAALFVMAIAVAVLAGAVGAAWTEWAEIARVSAAGVAVLQHRVGNTLAGFDFGTLRQRSLCSS